MKAEFLASQAKSSGNCLQRALRRWIGTALVSALGLATAGLCQAQGPGLPTARLTSVFPPGGQRGTTVEVTILGSDLEDANLQFSDPGITAAPKTTEPGLGQADPQPVPGTFLVTIKPEAKLGVHDVRAVGKYGISTPRAFVVGSLPETVETEPKNKMADALPVTVGSTINGRSNTTADQDYFKFTAQKGQRLTFDCWAYRIDSRMDATLVLFDSQGAEVARNRDTNRSDPLLDVVIPADGEYYLLVYDFLYGGSNDHFYRVTVSAAPYIDFVMPPVGQAGTLAKFTLYGCNLPGSRPSTVMVEGKPLEMLEVQVQMPGDAALGELAWVADVEPGESGMDGIEYHLDSPQGPSNAVLLGITSSPVIVEQEGNNTPEQAQRVTAPCEICGQFNPRRDEDWYTFEAKKGDSFWIEVYSERLGEPTDPFLLVQQVTKDAAGKEDVKELKVLDDTAQAAKTATAVLSIGTEDPAYQFVAPADGMIRILVRNLYYTATGDPRHIYRLAIRPPKPDFRLLAVPRTTPDNATANQVKPNVHSPVLRRGGSEIVDIYLYRRDGFEGSVVVNAVGLPAGVSAEPLTILAGQNGGELVLTAADNAAPFRGTFEVAGSAKIGSADVSHKARGAALLWLLATPQNPLPPRARLARALPLAVLAEEAPYSLDVDKTSLEVSRAGKLKLPIKIVRRTGAKDKIALQAFGLPKEITAPNGNVDANVTETSLELTVAANTKPGPYSFSIVGIGGVDYTRNPEALEAVKSRQAAVEKIVAERTAAVKTANDAKQAAEQKAAAADAAAKAAAEKAKAAQEAAAKDAGNQSLAEAKAAADKSLAEATAELKAANDAKAAATTAASAAAANLTAATTFQQTFGQTVTDMTNKTKPSKVTIGASSPGITLIVDDAPIKLVLAQGAVSGRAAAKVEVPLTITRLPDFKDPVQLRVKSPPAGIAAPPVTIAADQAAGTLVLDIGPKVSAGQQKLTIEAVAKLGGQELIAGSELVLTVDAAEPEKKP